MAKTTIEIDKQLQEKADAFIREVSTEVSNLIRTRFEKYMGGQASYKRLDFFTGSDVNGKDLSYYSAYMNKDDGYSIDKAFVKTFQKSFKDNVVEQMTRELLKKLEVL